MLLAQLSPPDRAICVVLLDHRDPLLQSERTQGFAADPVYAKGEVFAYVGLPQNLKDLKARGILGSNGKSIHLVAQLTPKH